MTGTHPLPDLVKTTLTIRIGEPLGKARKGWKEDIQFLISDGISTLEQTMRPSREFRSK